VYFKRKIKSQWSQKKQKILTVIVVNVVPKK